MARQPRSAPGASDRGSPAGGSRKPGRRLVTAALVALPVVIPGAWRSAPGGQAWPPAFSVYELQYATLIDLPASSPAAPTGARAARDIAMVVWLLEAPDGRAVLVDAGFYRDEYRARWRLRDWVRPSEALDQLGIMPDEIGELIITHVHWDHLDGVDLFPNAVVWIQREEFEHHVDPEGWPRNRSIEVEHAAMLARLGREGRLKLIDGDAQEIIPGITVYTGGRHSRASQAVAVRTSAGVVVLTSDDLCPGGNDGRRPSPDDPAVEAAHRQSLARLQRIASDPGFVVAGHDPAAFGRFPAVLTGVVAIPR